MKPLSLFAPVACAVACLAAASAVALDGPEETVKRLYAMEGWSNEALGPNTLLARDLVAAYRKDVGTDEPGPMSDTDWRYGASGDYDVSDLSVASGVNAPSIGGVTMMDVTVTYRDFNQPRTILWRMCLARKGWRVADVQGQDAGGPWSAREAYGLRKDRIKC